jgi:Glycosyl transferases group 1
MPALPSFRWAIKTAAIAGPTGDLWGDVHFAAALAEALESLGQQVVIDRRQAVGRPSAQLDDVVLVLRGLDRVEPQPGAVNLLWVISHPELVTPDELAAYDQAFAASISWSAAAASRAGVTVEPLLQATDPQRFQPGDVKPGSGPKVLFVGNSRKVVRPIVRHAVAAQLPLTIYGSMWDSLVDASFLAGDFVPNDQLSALYRGAGVVLNDHWDDMAREGFLSNRLFDAVASGARVISDNVAGLRDVFGPEVQLAESAEDLARLAGALHGPAVAVPGDPFPDEPTLLAASRRIRREHTFEVRARRLLDVAARIAAERSPNGQVAGNPIRSSLR